MEENKRFEMDDSALEQVSGGIWDDSWADGHFMIGDEIDFTIFRPEGCICCGTLKLIGTITGISGYAHSIRVKSKCCGMTYSLDVDNRTVQ